jgi:tetratricopeptide (TPR) repeat protein
MSSSAGTSSGASADAPPAAHRPAWRALWPWLALFLLAAGLRYGVLSTYERRYPLAQVPVIDERAYEQWGQRIAAGDWLGDEVFFQEPLYPYFIGAVYSLAGEPPAARAVLRRLQVLLGAGTCLLVAAVARRAFGPAPGFLAGLLLALHGPTLLLPAWLLKPNLFLPLLAGLAWLLLNTSSAPGAAPKGRLFALGVLAGLGALLRGNMLLLLPILCAAPLLLALRQPRGGRLRALPACAAILGGVLLVLLPVALRNQAVGGVFALTTSGAGTNVYGGNNLENPYGRASEFSWVRGIPEHEAGDWRREAERRVGRSLDMGEVSAFWLGETWRSMQQAPVAHARILWNKLRLTLSGYEVPDNHSYDWDRRQLGWLSAWPIDWRLCGSLGLAGLLWWLQSRQRPAAGGLLAALFVLYLGTIVATVTSDRVRLALLVPLLPFAGLFAAALPAAWRSGGPLRWRLGACLALGALPVLWSPLTPAQRAEDLAERDFNLAVELLRDPAGFAEALSIARGLAERFPSDPRVSTLLSDAEARSGFEGLRSSEPEQRAAAQTAIRAALKRLEGVVSDPRTNPKELFRARSLAGWIQLELGRPEVAERRFREALAFDPQSRDLRLGLATALEARARQAPGDAGAPAWLEEARQLRAGLGAPGEGSD